MDFANSVTTNCDWTIMMPDNYDGGTLDVEFVWTTGTSGSGDVTWGIEGFAVGNGGTLDYAQSGATEVIDTFIAMNDVHISTAGTLTLENSPSGGDIVQIRVYRKGASDTFTKTAKLIAVRLKYSIDSYSDV